LNCITSIGKKKKKKKKSTSEDDNDDIMRLVLIPLARMIHPRQAAIFVRGAPKSLNFWHTFGTKIQQCELKKVPG
jgi:hypothetical protein